MATDIKVPALGESVTEATVGQWFKKPGEAVKVDEPLVELETDKVTVEVPSPVAGVLSDIMVQQGSTVGIGSVLGSIKEGAAATAQPAASPQPAPAPAKQPEKAAAPAKPAPAAPPSGNGGMPPAPAARKMMEEKGLSAGDVQGSGRRGQVLKEDVAAAAAKPSAARAAPESAALMPMATVPVPVTQMRGPSVANDAAREERVRMTRLRQTIARRLKDAQNTAAMLTTFNDVDMSAIMKLRSEYKELFEKRHHVKLGFMGFFVKACIHALHEIPAVNAEIDGEELVYKNYYNIGIAVGTDRGLVVPVVEQSDDEPKVDREEHHVHCHHGPDGQQCVERDEDRAGNQVQHPKPQHPGLKQGRDQKRRATPSKKVEPVIREPVHRRVQSRPRENVASRSCRE